MTHGQRAIDPWQALLEEARSGAWLADSPVHGDSHWRAVAAVGLQLNSLVPRTSKPLLLAFGLLHDCRRQDENWDPQHGARAADVAQASLPLRDLLTGDEIDTLAHACLLHEKGKVDREDHNVGLCWDSDRYNLLRLDIEPDRRLLSAPIDEDQHEQIILVTETLWRRPPSWEALFRMIGRDIEPIETPAPEW